MEWEQLRPGHYSARGWVIFRYGSRWVLRDGARTVGTFASLKKAKEQAELVQSIRDSAQANERKVRSDRAKAAWQQRKRRHAQQQQVQQQPEPTYRPGQRYRSIDDP